MEDKTTSNGENTLLPAAKVAELLTLSTQTLAGWRCKGIGPEYVKIGFRVFYTPKSIDAYIKSKTFASTSEASAVRSGIIPADHKRRAAAKAANERPRKRGAA